MQSLQITSSTPPMLEKNIRGPPKMNQRYYESTDTVTNVQKAFEKKNVQPNEVETNMARAIVMLKEAQNKLAKMVENLTHVVSQLVTDITNNKINIDNNETEYSHSNHNSKARRKNMLKTNNPYTIKHTLQHKGK